MDISMLYLDPAQVMGKRKTATPQCRSRSGYGNKLPTCWQLQLMDKRWRRVYVICWSNSGSAYIITKSGMLFLGAYDPSYNPNHPYSIEGYGPFILYSPPVVVKRRCECCNNLLGCQNPGWVCDMCKSMGGKRI